MKQLTDSQLATVLYALRKYQVDDLHTEGFVRRKDFFPPGVAALGVEEVDKLCEALNMQDFENEEAPAPPRDLASAAAAADKMTCSSLETSVRAMVRRELEKWSAEQTSKTPDPLTPYRGQKADVRSPSSFTSTPLVDWEGRRRRQREADAMQRASEAMEAAAPQPETLLEGAAPSQDFEMSVSEMVRRLQDLNVLPGMREPERTPDAPPAPDAAPKQEAYSTGAKRSSSAAGCRLSLIPWLGVLRIGQAAAEGAKKYGEDNYLKGMPVRKIMDHLAIHYALFLLGDRSEDHLGHMGWNICAAIEMFELRPDMRDMFFQPESDNPNVQAMLERLKPLLEVFKA